MKHLTARLQTLDGKGYKAYKALQGRYDFGHYTLIIDHVQGDPYSAPSRIRLLLQPQAAGFPPHCYANPIRRIALEDYLCRALARAIRQHVKGHRGSGHSGDIRIATCGQQVLQRDALVVDNGRIEARLGLALPASGRRILAREAATMICRELPKLVAEALQYRQLDPQSLSQHLNSVEDQAWLRNWLPQRQLRAFVADGSILPRRSGIDDRPLQAAAIPFQSPPSLAVQVQLPHGGEIRGMGIGAGLSLIVGGGFHGKSTLLQALEHGVYDHIPGDGRERVVCDPGAVKIRAEDGRAVRCVDISGFINNLPLGQDTRRFSTDNASGSTSQAANIIEALACGSRTLLIDEDTSATNFMIRDRRMQMLVAPEREPITPLIDRIQHLSQHHRVSTVLVTGGSSAYFDVADRVILMDHYQAEDVSDRALQLSRPHQTPQKLPPLCLKPVCSRRLTGVQPAGNPTAKPIKIQAVGRGILRIGDDEIDLGRVEQLVEPGQLLAIGYLLQQLPSVAPETPVLQALQQLLSRVQCTGLESLSPYRPEPHGGLTLPRLHELFAALNRLRGLPLEAE